jgi:hypothetical protein
MMRLERSPPYVWFQPHRFIMSWPLSHVHMQIW